MHAHPTGDSNAENYAGQARQALLCWQLGGVGYQHRFDLGDAAFLAPMGYFSPRLLSPTLDALRCECLVVGPGERGSRQMRDAEVLT